MNVCNGTDLPELEIISLLEEQLPVYRLRADTIFGYEQDDWLHVPLLEPDAALDLTAEQIEETLKYFLLCADRVGQMTKTYSDLDAVTHLLEEKERDLELAARIGQSLLKKNKTLSEKNELLEEQVEHLREEVSQLRHNLSMKDELLQFYTNAADESEEESTTSTPVRPSETSLLSPVFFPLDSLQKKLNDLEEENKSLRCEATHLQTETISYEEKEQQLVNDCVNELRHSNLQISSLSEELARKSDDACRQQEEITHLLSQIVDLQKKAKLYAVENQELTQHLGAAKDAQRQLTAELRELQDKYAESMEMLHEAQEELKNLRNKSLPISTPRRFHSLGLFPMDSLAAEIEGTMRKELQMDDPDVEEQRLQPKRVFQTVKNLNLMRQQRSSLAPSPLNIPGSNRTSCLTSGRSSRLGTPRSNSVYDSEMGSSIVLDNRTCGLLEGSDDGSEDSNKRPPGTPGSTDLEAALRRLSLRRDNYISEKRFFEEERERKLAYLAPEEEKGGRGSSGGPATPTESLLSLGSIWSGYSFSTRSYLPDKLQIVKPLEGSVTLHAWQQLAQPHMGALLDHRPGVVTKGFRTLEQEQEEDRWQLDQPEEDELLCHSFFGVSGERDVIETGLQVLSAPANLLRSTSPPAVCCPRNRGADDDGRSGSSQPGGFRAGEAIQVKDRHGAKTPHSFSFSSPSPSPPPSPPQMNGYVDLKELRALRATTMDQTPVKCVSHTSSTYTFTTCRILHPSDQLTSVSQSPALASCQSSSSISAAAPISSPVPFSSPPTPSYTPCCTPRRLSFSLALGESSTNLRESTKTTSTSLGLVRLLLEQGISASVYDPRSWDRGLEAVGGEKVQQRGNGPEEVESTPKQKCPDFDLLQPSTPPNSPLSKRDTTRQVFQFSPSSSDDPAFNDTFLASKPARTILREVLGEAERELGRADEEVLELRLVDKLKCFRALPPHVSPGSALLAPFGSTGLGTSALGGGLRRNRSYPAMVGASMAMKDPGGPPQHRDTPDAARGERTPPRGHSEQTPPTLDTPTPQTTHSGNTHPTDPSGPSAACRRPSDGSGDIMGHP